MQLGDAAYSAHLRECSACRLPHYRHITRPQHRPHTFGPDCWCIGHNLPKVCELQRKEWQDLPEVAYI